MIQILDTRCVGSYLHVHHLTQEAIRQICLSYRDDSLGLSAREDGLRSREVLDIGHDLLPGRLGHRLERIPLQDGLDLELLTLAKLQDVIALQSMGAPDPVLRSRILVRIHDLREVAYMRMKEGFIPGNEGHVGVQIIFQIKVWP